MEPTKKPDINLAKKTLPKPLFQALEEIYSLITVDTALTGGTALAGFYAAHRSSDDLDLFSANKNAHDNTIIAVKQLEKKGAKIHSEQHSPLYFRRVYEWHKHLFTVDVVVDENFHKVGNFHQVNQIIVADLKTIFMTKIATLVSRCSEKDLYDLWWLFQEFSKISFKTMIEYGQKIDAGVTGENILTALAMAKIDKTACGFAVQQGVSANTVYKKINLFKNNLQLDLSKYLHKHESGGGIGEIVKQIKQLK